MSLQIHSNLRALENFLLQVAVLIFGVFVAFIEDTMIRVKQAID